LAAAAAAGCPLRLARHPTAHRAQHATASCCCCCLHRLLCTTLLPHPSRTALWILPSLSSNVLLSTCVAYPLQENFQSRPPLRVLPHANKAPACNGAAAGGVCKQTVAYNAQPLAGRANIRGEAPSNRCASPASA
jgi:hypothetical protein